MKRQALDVSASGLVNTSNKVKVWAQDSSAAQARNARASDEPANPMYLLAAITLGIPALLLVPLVGMNPGIHEGTLEMLVKLLVFSAFIVGAIFEIKRLADHVSDEDSH